MNQQQMEFNDINLSDFLAVSRKYFGLPLAERNRPARPLQYQTRYKKTMSQYRHLARTLVLASGLGAFAAAPAFAEMSCNEMNGQGNQHERHAKQIDQHHKALREALNLTSAQEPGWQRLLDSEHPKAAANAGQPIDWSKLTAPERAEKMLELSKIRQEQMAEHVAALKTFYASLTPAQQKAFEDAHVAPRSAMGMMGPATAPPS